MDAVSRCIGVPATIDDTGSLRDGVEVRYERHARGTIQLTSAVVSRDATRAAVLACGAVIDRAACYNAALSKLRALWERLEALVQRGRTPLHPGSAIWDSHQALLKFDDLIALRQSVRMGHQVVTPEVLEREVEFFERYHAHHDIVVTTAEKTEGPTSSTQLRSTATPSGNVATVATVGDPD